MAVKATKKVSAAKIANDRKVLASLYSEFEMAQAEGDSAEEDRLAEELVKFAFNPDAEATR